MPRADFDRQRDNYWIICPSNDTSNNIFGDSSPLIVGDGWPIKPRKSIWGEKERTRRTCDCETSISRIRLRFVFFGGAKQKLLVWWTLFDRNRFIFWFFFFPSAQIQRREKATIIKLICIIGNLLAQMISIHSQKTSSHSTINP